MSWQLAVVGKLFFSFLVSPVLMKMLSSSPSRIRLILLQYTFATLLATTFALVVGGWEGADSRNLLVAGVGVLNAFACYAQWRAVNISLSKNSLFTQADDLIALALGYIILGEGQFLNTGLICGIGISLLAVTLFIVMRSESQESVSWKIWETLGIWVAIYSVLWGVMNFAIRSFALKGISLPHFVMFFYGGSFVGASLLSLLTYRYQVNVVIPARDMSLVMASAAVIALAQAFVYLSLKQAPLTVVQPIYLVGEMVLPTLIGLWVFKEHKDLNRWGRTAIALGLTGSLLIGFSY